MTFCMDILVQLNAKTPFKFTKCGYNASGAEGTLLDVRDGQMYSIEVKPLGITLSPEAIDDAVNPEAITSQEE